MKSYLEIPGPSKAPQGPCIAFYKYDGSCFRAEWSRKRGWYKFGTRTQLIDTSSPDFGNAIPVFLETYGDSVAKVFKDNFRGVESIVAFCEYFGPNSFAGQHDPSDKKQVVLFDVNIHKKGFMLPRDFVKTF